MAFSLVNTGLLAFLTLAALPVLIHLFARRRPRRVPVPSLRYILPVSRQTQRMRRPRDILILILRTLLLIAMVMMFVRPVYYPKRSLSRSGRARRAVLLIDRSLSMQCNEGGLTRFGSAKAAALQVLDLLPKAALANIVWMGSSYETTVDKLTDNVELLRRDVESKPVSFEMAAVQPAFDKAVELLGGRQGGRVYVISDFQTSNWKRIDLSRIPGSIEVLNLMVGGRRTPNLGAEQVRMTPASPVIGETFSVSCVIANMTPAPVEPNVMLTFGALVGSDVSAPAGIVRQQTVPLEAYSRGAASFDCVLTARGWYPFKVSIEQDALSPDNTRYGVVHVSPAIRVGVCVAANDPGAGYLKCAIAAQSPGGGAIRVREMPMQALAQPDRIDRDVVFLYGWDGREHEMVARAIAGSPATFVWMLPASDGKRVDSSLLSSREAAFGGWRKSTRRNPLRLAVADEKHALMDVFDEGRSGDVGQSFFKGAHEIRGSAASAVLSYGRGTPALATVGLKNRQIFLWNMAIDPRVSNFAGSNTFLPLVQELILQNRIHKAPPSFLTGDGIALPLPADIDGASLAATLRGNGEAWRLAQSRMIVLPRGEGLQLLFDRADEPGHYQFSDRSGPLHLVAANVPAVEMDLRAMDEKGLDRGGQTDALVLGRDSIRSAHRGVPLWPYLLTGVVVLFLTESLLLAIWRLRQ